MGLDCVAGHRSYRIVGLWRFAVDGFGDPGPSPRSRRATGIGTQTSANPDWSGWFQLQETQLNVPPPSRVLFLEPDSSRLVPFDSKIPMMNKEGLLYELPPLFARFTLTNGGRVPVVRVRIPVTIFFYPNPHDVSNAQQEQTAVDIPLLVPGGTFDFAVANASTLNVRYEFSRKASLTRIDTEKADEMTLFADDGVANNEHQIINGYARREWERPK
jgi:hypothetical protein